MSSPRFAFDLLFFTHPKLLVSEIVDELLTEHGSTSPSLASPIVHFPEDTEEDEEGILPHLCTQRKTARRKTDDHLQTFI
jgi:hypothetical protein